MKQVTTNYEILHDHYYIVYEKASKLRNPPTRCCNPKICIGKGVVDRNFWGRITNSRFDPEYVMTSDSKLNSYEDWFNYSLLGYIDLQAQMRHGNLFSLSDDEVLNHIVAEKI